MDTCRGHLNNNEDTFDLQAHQFLAHQRDQVARLRICAASCAGALDQFMSAVENSHRASQGNDPSREVIWRRWPLTARRRAASRCSTRASCRCKSRCALVRPSLPVMAALAASCFAARPRHLQPRSQLPAFAAPSSKRALHRYETKFGRPDHWHTLVICM